VRAISRFLDVNRAKDFLVGAISGAVLNYVCNVKSERSGICFAFGVALTSGIADMKN
jgi:hypothetical protein